MQIFQNRDLKSYSTFKIGGSAKFLIEIHSIEDAIQAMKFIKEKKLPWMAIGKGSNCLFPDAGFNGVALINQYKKFEQFENVFEVGSGFSFSYLGRKTAELGYSGLEFASGIPGSVGGAVYMNAGASGKETSECLKQVTYLDSDGNISIFEKNQLKFSYRKSCFQNMKGMIMQAVFELHVNPMALKLHHSILEGRIKSQPYSDTSIGCFFKNPSKDISAGKLIDSCGLKGYKVGGAEVSKKHANFIINQQNASSQDVIKLKELIKQKVFEKTGILLEEEVQILNDFTV